MNHLEAIMLKLATSVDLYNLVGGAIYPLYAPQGINAPFLITSVVSAVPTATLQGTPDMLIETARVQFDAYAKTYMQAHAIADAVDAVIAAIADAGFSATRDNQTDLYDPESRLCRVSTDYTILR
jgi:hypothetical protein